MNKWTFLGACTDEDNGRTDMDGDACSLYYSSPSICGYYDDGDFIAADLCCSCGGGNRSPGKSDLYMPLYSNSNAERITKGLYN